MIESQKLPEKPFERHVCLLQLNLPQKKNGNICLSETAYQHKRTRKKYKKTTQAALILWQRQCLMDKPHPKPCSKSKTGDISNQSPSPLHHTFSLGRVRFTAQSLFALALLSGEAALPNLLTVSLPSPAHTTYHAQPKPPCYAGYSN